MTPFKKILLYCAAAAFLVAFLFVGVAFIGALVALVLGRFLWVKLRGRWYELRARFFTGKHNNGSDNKKDGSRIIDADYEIFPPKDRSER